MRGNTVPLGIWFGQFNIVGGQIQEEGPYVGIFEGMRGASGVGVYVIAEPVGGATPRICDEVLEIIARTFGSPEQALTANLLRATGAAHQHVRDWNRLHPGDRSAGVGLSCLAIRGDEAYLAQCGPSLAVAHTGGRFRVAAPAGDDSRRPLGMGERTAPVFTRFSLRQGDVIVLAFSAADRLLDRGTLINLANTPPEDAMPLLYTRVGEAQHFGALYLGAVEQEPLVAPSPYAPAPPAQPFQPLPPSQPVWPQPEPSWPQPEPEPGLVRGRFQGQPPYAGSSNGENWEEDEVPLTGAGGWGADRGSGTRMPARARLPSPSSLGVLGDGRALLSRRTAVLLAAAIAVVLLLILVVPALARRGSSDRYQELVRAADAGLADAQGADDPERRRAILNQAESDLVEAQAIRPEAGDIGERLSRIAADRAAMDRIRELTDLRQITDLSGAGIAAESAIELVVGRQVFVLDAASGKVLAVKTEQPDAAEVVFEPGRAIGSEKTGKARHIAQAQTSGGQPETLLVLDSNRRLYAVSPGAALRQVPLNGADVWKTDSAMAVASNALYVLDAGGEQLWRFGGSAAGYDTEPEPLISRASLKDAVGLSISGEPIVATSAGRLARIVDGRDVELRPVGLDRKLTAPSAPVFNINDGMLYVADRGNQRIVVLDTAGVFQWQLVHRRLAGLRAVALDEASGLLYAVSGQSLLVTPVPK